MHIGVTLFFVLSGFVITWRYDRRGPKRDSYLRDYFVNRFARIYPLYLALVVPTMLLNGESSLRHWILNLTVFSAFDSGIPQAWSLRVEECFYLSAPLLFLAWRRHPALLLGIAASLLAALFPVAKLPATTGIIGPPYHLFLNTFFGRFFEFYVGIWLAKRVARSGGAGMTSGGIIPVFTLVGGAGIAGVIVALAAIRASAGGVYGTSHPAGIVLNNLVLPLFIAAFYWGLIREPGLFRRALSGRVADLLGRSSYALYLIHAGTLIGALVRVLVAAAGLFGVAAAARAMSLAGHVSVTFVFVNVLAIALYKTIEMPANRFLRRRFGSPEKDRNAVPGKSSGHGAPAVGPGLP